MKPGPLSRLYLIIALLSVIAALSGYLYSGFLYRKVYKIWEQTLWDDCVDRMGEIGVVKKQMHSSTAPSGIKVVTERDTLYMERADTSNLSVKENDFFADQYYLSVENPVKIEKLDSLFRLKLKENGLGLKTAVSMYNGNTRKKTIYGIDNDSNLLFGYLKLTCRVDIRDVYVLDGYVKNGHWMGTLFCGKGYYLFVALAVWNALNFWLLKSRKPDDLLNSPQCVDEPLILPIGQDWQEAELAKERTSDVLTILLDKRKHVLIYVGNEILLAPKVFGLFYLLSQGKDHFQSYEFLLQNLWPQKGNADKKHLDQLVARLRKDLKGIPGLGIEAVRGSGYKIDWAGKIVHVME